MPLPGAAELFAILVVFVRVGSALMVLPGLSASYVSMRIRLVLALLLALMLQPVLSPTLPPLPDLPSAMALTVVCEMLIGAFLGLLPRLAIAALHTAGTFISFFGSFASAIADDSVADQQSSTLASFLGTAGVVLVFVTDLHHLMLRAIAESYGLFVPGSLLPANAMTATLAQGLAGSFALALQLSAPFLIVGLASNVALGLLGRLMPQLPILFFGMPFQIGLQLWVLMLGFSGIMLVFLNRFSDAFAGLAGG